MLTVASWSIFYTFQMKKSQVWSQSQVICQKSW